MTYRIHEIKLSPGEGKAGILGKIKRRISADVEITGYKIARESIDARDKGDIKYVYSVDFDTDVELPNFPKAPDETYRYPSCGTKPLSGRPVIAGFGPCGMFASLLLSELGYAPLILERGKPVEERIRDVARFWSEGVLDVESNVQFGEGGAGTFSDGKLTTGIKDVRVKKVLAEFVLAGAGDDILYKQKPHIGTDVLRKMVKAIREKIVRNGGEILFGTRLLDIATENGKLIAVKTGGANGTTEIETEILILAVGHSARDTARALFNSGVQMEQKPFSIGLRIEHLQEIIDKAQYGKNAGAGLSPAEYKLAAKSKSGRGVYTFCVCPGGEVIVASSGEGCLVTNGMSNRARDGKYANSALLVDVRTSDFESQDPLSGILFQEKYERAAFEMAGRKYQAPAAKLGDFMTGAEAALPVVNSLPDFAVAGIREAVPIFARKIKGFDNPGAVVYAVESRSSSPVRVTRGEDYQSNVKGAYPGGEGAGYAGGIVSAAVDGIKIAEEIIRNYARRA
ncbi:MAG: NAD(FAD)-utilizing dehydrogenase [Clostridiales bacterium]|nr:NAD(FAD)-utilizing dehydrogenase [Clostridiales bacterium]